MKVKGYFLISLDFELHWGRFDKVILDKKRRQELDNTLQLIPQILKLFSENNIAATWAVVGMLFNDNKSEWQKNIPYTIPNYKNDKLSAYNYFSSFEEQEHLKKYFFSNDLINQIIASPNQELATHTYSHYYCLEDGQVIQNFKDDLVKSNFFFKKRNCKMSSLVLPRNQYNAAYKGILEEMKIETVRTNPSNWYWNANNDNYSKKIFRFIETFNLFSYDKCLSLQYFRSQIAHPYYLPASRFLRSWSPIMKILNHLKLKKILNEMTFAAKHNRYYHIWWHPENFGLYPDECLKELQIIINHFIHLKKKYGFETKTMKGFGDLIKNKAL